MGQPFIGEIRMFGGNFAPVGWAFCNGQLLAITDNDVLFNLIGTTYGGDGQTTFQLPDLRSRVPVHQGTSPVGSNYVMGQYGGVEAVTLTTQQMPAHTHTPSCRAAGSDSPNPANAVWGASDAAQYAAASTLNTFMNAGAIGSVGGNQPHDNMLPILTVNFIISLYGIFPSQS
jgi:microcystin-dependent protein